MAKTGSAARLCAKGEEKVERRASEERSFALGDRYKANTTLDRDRTRGVVSARARLCKRVRESVAFSGWPNWRRRQPARTGAIAGGGGVGGREAVQLSP